MLGIVYAVPLLLYNRIGADQQISCVRRDIGKVSLFGTPTK